MIYRNMIQPDVRKRKETNTEAVRRVMKIMVMGWRLALSDPVRNYRLDAEYSQHAYETIQHTEIPRLEAKRDLAIQDLQRQADELAQQQHARVIL